HTAGTWLVFDNNTLVEHSAQLLGQQAPHGIDTATGRERHNDRNGFFGVSLRHGRSASGHANTKHESCQQLVAYQSHISDLLNLISYDYRYASVHLFLLPYCILYT